MILIADDDPRIRRLLRHTLALGNYEATEVEDGARVLEVVRAGIPDLLLMDVDMPVMDGITTCRALRAEAKTADIPVILISAHSDEVTMLKGLDGGADDYVVKPFQPAILLAKVRATLRARAAKSRTASVVDLSPGTAFDGRFVIQTKLGHGGMGVVYRAFDRDENRDVAIKIQTPIESSAVARAVDKRFKREIATLAEITHPNVIQILSAGIFQGLHYYSMQYIDGPPLSARLEAQGALSVAVALRIAADIADGLAAVHARGFVHRDVKPGNIFLDSSDVARIGDFGVVFPVERERTRLTMDGRLVGTPLYMAPEQILGADVDPRSDVFSLGMVLFEMLTGKPCRDSNVPASALVSFATSPTRSPCTLRPSIPALVEALCLRACRIKAGERFQSARAFGATLRRTLEEFDKDLR